MKKRTLRAASVALVALVGISLAACSSGSSGSSDDTLTVYGWKGSKTAPAGVPAINKAFEKANPGVTVKYEYLDAGDTTNQRLNPELLAGDGPDVFMVDNSGMKTYQGNGYLADLSDEAWVSKISDVAKPFAEISGKTYAAPLELIPIGLYANMDVLKEAGISTFPATNDEFMSDLAKLKQADLPGLAMPNKGAYTDEAVLNGIASTLVYSKNPDWDKNFTSGKTDFSDWDSSVDQLLSLNKYTDLKSDLGVDEWGQGLQDFKAGKTAFLYQGGWNLTDFQKSVPSVQFGPWPASNTDSQWATVFSGVNWAVNASSKHQELAKKYVSFWTENLDGFLKAEAAYSPYTGDESPTNDGAKLVNDAFTAGDYRLLSTNTWMPQANEDTMGQDVQSLVLGKTTKAQMLKKWNKFAE